MFYFLYDHTLIYNKTSLALGNNRPKILVQLEDHVLRAIISLSEGMSREKAIDTLYTQILALKEDLANDEVALAWFDLARAPCDFPSTPPKSKFSSSLLADDPFAFRNCSPNNQVMQFFKEGFHGRFNTYIMDNQAKC